MAITKTRKAPAKKTTTESDQTTLPKAPTVRAGTTKVTHITSGEITEALNSAVANINSVFQLRDHLINEANVIKDELNISNEIRIEKAMLDEVKREEEKYIYDFNMKKERLEKELEQMEDDRKERLIIEESEHKAQLKADSQIEAQKIRYEKQEHDRKLAMEKEDWKREKELFNSEKAAFTEKVESFEEERDSLREKLVEELNRDNAHAIEVLKLNQQREIELLKGELRLEQANRAKFETMLKEAREQNVKLGEQLTSLSKEALTSASSSSMAAKLKDIVSEMSMKSSQRVS